MPNYFKKNLTLTEWNNYSPEEQRAYQACIRPRNDDELKAYIKKFFGVVLPETCHPDCAKKLVPCTPPYKVFSDAYFGRYDTIILKGARGAGKSALLALLALTEQVSLNAEVIILAASEIQAKLVFGYVSGRTTRFVGKFWDCPNSPKALKDKNNELLERSRLVTGGQIKCIAASETSILGQRPTRLRVDEADILALELIDFALPCVFPHPLYPDVKPQTLIASTHYRANGTLSDLILRAEKANEEAGELVAPVYSFCYKDVHEDNGGHITADQVKSWKVNIPKEVWLRQYENAEPAIDNALFSSEDIDFMFDASLGVFKGNPDEPCMVPEQFWPSICEGYYHGTDFGDKVDWTVISSFISPVVEYTSEGEEINNPDIMISWLRKGRCGLTACAKAYDELLIKYPGTAAHDGTGASQFVSEVLTEYSEPIRWTQQNKKENMNNFVVAVEQRKLKLPKIEWLEKQLRFLTYEEAFGTKHMPDGVASLIMAWYARKKLMRGFNIGGVKW